MKTLEEYKNDFLKLSRMFLKVLQTEEMVESFSITRYATAMAAIFSAEGCFPKDEAFDDLFYDIERVCTKTNPLQKDNHDTVLSILMYCLLLYQSSEELYEDYNEMQQLKKDFSTEYGRKILEYITEHPNCPQGKAAEYAGMSASHMSHFMAKNSKYQLWDVDKVGTFKYLKITQEGSRFIKYLNEEIRNDKFPHNVNEENVRLKKEVEDLKGKISRLEEEQRQMYAFTSMLSEFMQIRMHLGDVNQMRRNANLSFPDQLVGINKVLPGLQKNYVIDFNIPYLKSISN